MEYLMENLMENGQAFVAVCRTLCCFMPMEDVLVPMDVPLTEVQPCTCCLETDLQDTWCEDCWENWCDSQEWESECEESECDEEMVVENQMVVKNRDVRFPDEVWHIVVSYLEVKWTSLYQEAHRHSGYFITLNEVALANKIYYENQIYCHAELQISREVVWKKQQAVCYDIVADTLQKEKIVAITYLAKDRYYNGRIEKLRKLCDIPIEIRENTSEAYVLLRASATQGFYKNDKRKTRVSHPLESLELLKIGDCYVFGRECQCFSNSGKEMQEQRATEALRLLEDAGFRFHEYL